MYRKLGLFFVLLLVSACHKTSIPLLPEETVYPSEIRVGMLLDLSGKSAPLGESMKQAALLAQFEHADDTFILQFYDTKGTAEGAVEAADKAVEEGASMLLGPVFSYEASAIKGIPVPFISFTSDMSVTDAETFSMSLPLSTQVERMIHYAESQGKKKIAFLYPNTFQGQTMLEEAEKILADNENIELVKSVSYDENTINFDPTLLKLIPKRLLDHQKIQEEKLQQALDTEKERKNLLNQMVKAQENGEDIAVFETALEELLPPLEIGPSLDKAPVSFFLDFDVLFIAEEGNKLKSIASLLSFYDITPKEILYIGTATWDNNSLGKEPSLVGGRYPALPKEKYKEFAQKYQDTFGTKPATGLTGYAYDSVALIAALYNEKQLSYTALKRPEGFEGVYGKYRFTEDGKIERLMNIMEIRSHRKARLIEKAPDEFPVIEEFDSFDDWAEETSENKTEEDELYTIETENGISEIPSEKETETPDSLSENINHSEKSHPMSVGVSDSSVSEYLPVSTTISAEKLFSDQ